MISVYPIYYVNGRWEHLIINRTTVAYNWQCVTGGVERDEPPSEEAQRELLEETSYRTKTLIPFTYDENFFIDDEDLKLPRIMKHMFSQLFKKLEIE